MKTHHNGKTRQLKNLMALGIISAIALMLIPITLTADEEENKKRKVRFNPDDDELFIPEPKEPSPIYPHREPVVQLKYVFSATTQPPFKQIGGKQISLPAISGAQSFIVLITGRSIADNLETLQIKSSSPGVNITPIAVKTSKVEPDLKSQDPFNFGFAQLIKNLPGNAHRRITSMDAVIAQFDIDGGVLPGTKTFTVNGIEGDWILPRGTATAIMIAARSDWDNSHHQTDVVYHHDEIQLGLKSSDPIKVDQLEVTVMVDGKKAELVGMDTLILKNAGDGVTFSSGRLRIAPNKIRAAKMKGPTIVAHEYSQITLVTGLDNEFASRPTTSLMVYVTPARMLRYYPIVASINQKKSSYLWKEALQQAANLAGIKGVDWNDLTAEKAGEISNRIILGGFTKRKVNITVAQHAAMILLRRLFIEQMTEYLYVIPKNPSPEFLEIWRQMVLPHAKNPHFGPSMIQVSMPGHKEKMTYGEALQLPFYASFSWWGATHPVDIENFTEDRQAFLGWRAAVIKSILLAKETKIDDIEDMVELTGQSFDPVVKALLPRLVKLQQRGSPPELVWVPDTLARLAVQSIQSLGDQARAIDEVASADTAVVVSAASLVLFAPASVPTKVLCLAVEAGMAVEATSLVLDYFKSINAIDFATGASLILEEDSISAAKARAIPGWGVTLGVAGSFLGLGAETYGLISSIRVAKSIDRAMELLPQLNQGGHHAIKALSREDQIYVLSAMTASKAAQESRILKLDPNRAKLNKLASKIESEIKTKHDSWFAPISPVISSKHDSWFAPVAPYVDDIHPRGSTRAYDNIYVPGNTKVPKNGSPKVGSDFRIKGPKGGVQKITLEKFLGQGAFCDVYSIQGDPSRVVKVATDYIREGKILRYGQNTVENAQRIQNLLKKNDIPQLKILQFAPNSKPPFMVQEAIRSGEHHIFNWLKELRDVSIYGRHMDNVAKVKIMSDIVPRNGALPHDVQRAILKLFKKMAKADEPLAWEDCHIQNIFLRKATKSDASKDGVEYIAGILDQDRIARFSNLKEDEGMCSNLFYMEGNVEKRNVRSLADRIKPSNSASLLGTNGTLSPNADFHMAKMLEYKEYIKYNRDTKKFEKILFDPEIVEEFFPKLKQWVDPDLRNWKDTQIRLHPYRQENPTIPPIPNMGAALAA